MKNKGDAMSKIKLLVLLMNIAFANLMSAVLWTYFSVGTLVVTPPDGSSAFLFILLCSTPFVTVAFLAFEQPNMFARFKA